MRNFKIFSGILFATMITFSSCETIETSSVTLDLTQTATVSATFFAELNLSTPGLETIPNGTSVIVSIPNNSFNSTATGFWTTTAETVNGRVEVEVPATDNGVTVTFIPAEFTFAQTQTFGANSATINSSYSSSNHSVTGVRPGQVRAINASYNTAVALPGHYEMVNLTYELRAVLRVGQTAVIIPNQQVNVFVTNEWTTTATTNAQGRLTISVPASRVVNFRFTASKDMDTTPATNRMHRYDTTNNSPATSTPVLRVLNFGDGQLWE